MNILTNLYNIFSVQDNQARLYDQVDTDKRNKLHYFRSLSAQTTNSDFERKYYNFKAMETVMEIKINEFMRDSNYIEVRKSSTLLMKVLNDELDLLMYDSDPNCKLIQVHSDGRHIRVTSEEYLRIFSKYCKDTQEFHEVTLCDVVG